MTGKRHINESPRISKTFNVGRFGADVLGWRQHCKTTRDFLRQGLMISSGYHIVTGIALLFWSAIGRPSVVSFVSVQISLFPAGN